MFDPDAIERMRAMQRDWEANELREFLERQPESRPEYRTGSLLPVERVYTPVDVADTALEALGLPGRYPFTRGRTRPCTGDGSGRCGRSRATGREAIPTGAFTT